MENKNFNWRPMSEYTGGRVLATNGLDVLIGEINSEGDCESEEDSGTILCGITGFIKIEEMLPELKESEDEKVKKEIKQFIRSRGMQLAQSKVESWIAWLEKQGEQSNANKEYWRGYREGKQEVLDKYSELEKQVEQKPIECPEYCVMSNCANCPYHPVLIKKPAWSEEDEVKINRIVACLENLNVADNDILLKDVDWLKSLRPQPKQEWSQNDIEMIDWLIRSCEKEHEELCNDKYGHQDIVSDLKRDCRKKWDWLESLKNRVIPKNQWKPSDEQITCLHDAIARYNREGFSAATLTSLLEQLKKLKG